MNKLLNVLDAVIGSIRRSVLFAVSNFPQKKEERSAKRCGRTSATSLFLSPKNRTNRVDGTSQCCSSGTPSANQYTVLFRCCGVRVFQFIAYHRLSCGAQGRFYFYVFPVVFILILLLLFQFFSFDFLFLQRYYRIHHGLIYKTQNKN